MTKVRMIKALCGDILYPINEVFDLDPPIAKQFVDHEVAVFVEDEHPIAKVVSKPTDMHPTAVEVTEYVRADEPQGETAADKPAKRGRKK